FWLPPARGGARRRETSPARLPCRAWHAVGRTTQAWSRVSPRATSRQSQDDRIGCRARRKGSRRASDSRAEPRMPGCDGGEQGSRGGKKRKSPMRAALLTGMVSLAACHSPAPAETPQNIAVKQAPEESYQHAIDDNAKKMLERGRDVFRDETFGSEHFWGDQLRLREVIAGEKHGGTGQGLSPRTALAVGLRVDFGRVPSA